MQPIGGLTVGLSKEAFHTELDDIVVERYDKTGQPASIVATDPTFFKQERFASFSHIWDEYSGIPRQEVHQEQEIVKTQDVFVGNKKTQDVVFYKNDYPVSIEAMKTDQHGLRETMGNSIADAIKTNQAYIAILDCYGDFFDGNNFTTPDGNSMANNSHTTLRGDTVDNLETGVATPDNVDTLARSLESQVGQSGDWGGYVLGGVLVSRNLYKHMKEILNSSLIADSGENNLNLFDTDYGQLSLKQSPLLGSTFNSNANVNTSYHFVANDHHIVRRVLVDMEMEFVEAKYTATDSSIERVRHAEVAYPETHSGYAASNGSV